MVGSRAGIFSSAAVTTAAARSSGRTSFSDPLNALPIGLRAVETMTASGTVPPGLLRVSKRSVALSPTMLLRRQVLARGGGVPSVVRARRRWTEPGTRWCRLGAIGPRLGVHGPGLGVRGLLGTVGRPAPL